MSSAFPVAGSVYTYASRSLGDICWLFRRLGIRWILLLTLTLWLHRDTYGCVGVPKGVWVVGLLSFSTVVNFFGIETTTRMNITLLGLQLVLLAVFLILGIVALIHGVGVCPFTSPDYNAKVFAPSLVLDALACGVWLLSFDADLDPRRRDGRSAALFVGAPRCCSFALPHFSSWRQTYLASLFVLGRTHFVAGLMQPKPLLRNRSDD